MRNILKRIGLFFLLQMICCTISAQIIITGVVKGDDNYGVPGANIKVKGSAQGTTSDIDGNYSISVPSEKSVLVYSFVGMSTKEEAVGKRRQINVTLSDNSELLDEVVVVGYGTMKKSDLTGAIGSYRPDEKEAAKMISVDNMLQGKIAGLSVGASTEAPGAASSVTIRGANSLRGDNQPLYVIDNIPQASTGEFASMGDNSNFSIATNALSSLNPADIESIEVLKDASATAIYGSRGANGVILITTKRGKAGKVQVGVSANFTIAKASNLLDMMDLSEHAIYRMIRSGGYMQDENGQWNIWANNEETGKLEWNNKFQYFVEDNNVYRHNGKDSKLNEEWSLLNPIDWQKEIYSNAFAQNYNVTLSGGTDKVTYFASAAYKDIEGLVKGTGLKQGDARLNLNADLSKTV
ncbi:MAG: SusC/RagA family TonB-linked outer membrane protein, partial [Bacteroidales bacterium]